MSVGDLIPDSDGWWIDKNTGNHISPEGVIYDADGSIIETPYDDDEYERTSPEEEYDD